jgi:hypothetical protein
VAATASPTAELSDSSSNPLVFTFTVDRSQPVNVTIHFNLSGTATFGVDYQPLPDQPALSCPADGKGCSVAVAAGAVNAYASFEALDDTIYEMDDSVVVTLVPGSYHIGSPNNATGLIQDDEDRVGLAGSRSHRRLRRACWVGRQELSAARGPVSR